MRKIVPVRSFQVGRLKAFVYEDSVTMGAAAAHASAQSLQACARVNEHMAVIFATGRSQEEMLSAFTGTPGLPWNKVIAFHMDEYVGIPETHPASFRAFLRKHLLEKVHLKASYTIDGDASNSAQICDAYSKLLQLHQPFLCLLGIGENGHIAFNDPGVADFGDPQLVKVVTLDEVCRGQQVAEGWFPSMADVPKQAISLTVPALFRVPKLIVSVPGIRKAKIVKRAFEGTISTSCPATILRSHPDATVYLDCESASLISEMDFSPEMARVQVGD
ncbi:MAG TPA: glucosamine-6-phosphate deaminase [Terriglobales bacterium]|nr:glucosamine-6-phosphate deaminase [Terriglobales bacterium]